MISVYLHYNYILLLQAQVGLAVTVSIFFLSFQQKFFVYNSSLLHALLFMFYLFCSFDWTMCRVTSLSPFRRHSGFAVAVFTLDTFGDTNPLFIQDLTGERKAFWSCNCTQLDLLSGLITVLLKQQNRRFLHTTALFFLKYIFLRKTCKTVTNVKVPYCLCRMEKCMDCTMFLLRLKVQKYVCKSYTCVNVLCRLHSTQYCAFKMI